MLKILRVTKKRGEGEPDIKMLSVEEKDKIEKLRKKAKKNG